MTRYQRGDLVAFATIVERHKTPLFNFVLRQIKTPPAAQDVLQEVFLRIIENASSFKHEAKFTTWAYTIARNLCIDRLRKASHRRHLSLDQQSGGDGDGAALTEQIADRSSRASTERGAIAAEIQAKVVVAVEALPNEQREVFLLRQIGNFSFQEIANITE